MSANLSKKQLLQYRRELRGQRRQILEFWLEMMGSTGCGKTSLTVMDPKDEPKSTKDSIELHKLKLLLMPKVYRENLPKFKEEKDNIIEFNIRDTSSKSDFEEVRHEFLKFQQAVVICISLVHNTLDAKNKAIANLSSCLKEIEEARGDLDIPIVLVGTKMDLREDKETHISPQEGEFLRSKYGFDAYFETSKNNIESVEKMWKGVFDLRCAQVQGTFAKQIKSSAGCSLN